MATVADRIGLAWEGYYPAAVATGCGAGVLAFGPSAFRMMVANGWQVGSLYSSVFDLATIFTAFLFTFYSFVVTTDRGFIGRAKNSRYYKLMVSYTLRTLVLGGALVVASIPIMVIEPKPTGAEDAALYLVAAWATLSGWTLAAFVRATHIFSIFAGQHA